MTIKPIFPRPAAGIALVCATYLLLTLTGITWGLPAEHSWSNDDIAPNVPLKAVDIYTRGTHKYPNLQLLMDRALYEPYLAWLKRRGALDESCRTVDSGCFDDAPRDLGRLILISRLRSVAMGLGIVAAVAALALALFGAEAALWAALLAATNETLGFYGKLGNLDVPHTLWFLLSVWAYVRVLGGGGRRAWLAFGVFAGAALATKEGIIGAYVLMGAAMLWALARPVGTRAQSVESRKQPVEPRKQAAIGWRESAARLGIMSLGLLGVYGAAQNALFNWPGLEAHIRYWLEGPGLKDGDRFQGAVWFADVLLRRAVEGAGWPQLGFLATAVVLGLASRTPAHADPVVRAAGLPDRRTATWWILIPCLSYLVFTIIPIRYVYTRYLLPQFLLAAVLGGCLASELWRGRIGTLRFPPAIGRAVVLVVLLHGAAFSLNNGLAMRIDTRIAAEAWLAASVPPATEVVAFGGDSYLPRFERLDLDVEQVSWKDLAPYRPEEADSEADDLSSAALALEAMIAAAGDQDLAPPRGAPPWLIVASRGDPPAGTPGIVLMDRLRAGDAGYSVAWSSDQAYPQMDRDNGRPSPLGHWLPGALVESRVSPGIWVLHLEAPSRP